jgi:hypothetical protein
MKKNLTFFKTWIFFYQTRFFAGGASGKNEQSQPDTRTFGEALCSCGKNPPPRPFERNQTNLPTIKEKP